VRRAYRSELIDAPMNSEPVMNISAAPVKGAAPATPKPTQPPYS